MKQFALMLLAGSLLIFNSCTKEGPRGPQGPQGNANVVGSDPFTVSTWAYDNAEVAYVANFVDADITQSVADHGVVQVFLWYASDGTWRPLPDIYNSTQFYFRYSQGGFDIYYGNLDGTVPAFPGTNTFRSVVIAPSFKQSHPNVDWKNYNEVMNALKDQDVKGTAVQTFTR